MIDPKIRQLLEELRDTDHGKALKEYLDLRIKSMKGNIDIVENWDDVLGRRKALLIIKDVFYFLENKQANPKKKNQYI